MYWVEMEGVGEDEYYFRLNIMGMQMARDLMFERGMILAEDEDSPYEVIPVHKLCSNDGWHVTPNEIIGSFTNLYAGGHSNDELPPWFEPNTYGIKVGYGPEGPPEVVEWWPKWLDWLWRASQHGGFRVY